MFKALSRHFQWWCWHFTWICATNTETWCRANSSSPNTTTGWVEGLCKQELDRLVKVAVLTAVDKPTDWVNLASLLDRCHQDAIKLNKHKLTLRVQKVDFMGHLLTRRFKTWPKESGSNIIKLPKPKAKEDIERLNGTVNYLAKFLPRLSHLMEPLRRTSQTGV